MESSNTLQKRVIFKFEIEKGGIGDLTKFFSFLLSICIKNNIKLYLLKTNNSVHKYLKLRNENIYISHNEIKNPTYLSNINQLQHILENKDYIIEPACMYSTFNYESINFRLDDIFCFSDEIIIKGDNFINTSYISIHLRLGDFFLETDKIDKSYHIDSRKYDEKKLFEFIELNKDKNIIFFCDNNSYKQKIKEKYNYVLITDYNIGHTGMSYVSEIQVRDTITEFYLMTKSDCIYMASNSGFPIMASKFRNINFVSIS
jgi:hypothetical protein